MAENGKEMCVTGGTGFIAAYLIRALLNKGYIVRATVRNPGMSLTDICMITNFFGCF